MTSRTSVADDELLALEERERRALRFLDAFPSSQARDEYRRAALEVLVHRLGHQ
ncbi:hypothetical protein [Arthrobacter agilis]|uniref:hypothetical protein n=1 Tax=Arthrobacter agilis TaxID=37921 RepID=UPI002780A67D|nr:hypothetical protein [Arthrobacter agilis]MDQ0736586.1 hypothetical protein [Arthrobacter agilis]